MPLMKPSLLLSVALLAFASTTAAQTVLFRETFGTISGSADGYEGDQGAIFEHNSGNLIRIVNPGTNGSSAGQYEDPYGNEASGYSYLEIGSDRNPPSIEIHGINTQGYSDFDLFFGFYTNNNLLADFAFSVEYKTENDTEWQSMPALTHIAGSGAGWHSAKIISFADTAQVLSLKINTLKSIRGLTHRLDDITVAGAHMPEPSFYAALVGLGAIGLVGYRRWRSGKR